MKKSGWVVPSIVTGLVIAGSGSVPRKIVLSPEATFVKSIVSATASEFAAVIASRSVHSVTSQEPVPGSAVELTWNVVAAPAGAASVNVIRTATHPVVRIASPSWRGGDATVLRVARPFQPRSERRS